MKNKILSLTLCFTILFSSLNINNSFASSRALSPAISAGMLGVVTTLAYASGVVLSSDDDLSDLGRLFYNKYEKEWDMIESVFKASVIVGANGLVTVGKDFLTYVKDFFDSSDLSNSNNIVVPSGSVPALDLSYGDVASKIYELGYCLDGLGVYDIGGGYEVRITEFASGGYRFWECKVYQGDSYLGGYNFSPNNKAYIAWDRVNGLLHAVFSDNLSKSYVLSNYAKCPYGSLSYSGSYDGSVIDSSKDMTVGVPKDLSNLVGNTGVDVFNPSYDLPLDGIVSLPVVDNPSISVEDVGINVDTSVGNPPVDSPTDTPGTWDWLINLVVPSSSYWANTFDTFFTNIGNAFPMININRFKDLCINGVPPKDIEVTIMGAKGKIFNTKYLNSIVDWLQPIVSAFMAFLLMLYNYRKVYKLIRGFEPFSGIADGNSVGEVRGKMDGAMPEMGGSSFVGPSTASTWSDGQSITRGSIQSRYYGRDL